MRTRPYQITIRLSSDELQTLKSKVHSSGLTQQQYITAVLNNKTITNTDGLRELIPEIKHIGNNINQIAKRLNSDSVIYDNDIEFINKGLVSIWALLKQFTVRHP